MAKPTPEVPLYEIVPGSPETGVEFVSLVDRPAIRLEWLAFNRPAKFHPNCRCEINDKRNVELAEDACDFCVEAKKAYNAARRAGKRLPAGIDWVAPDDLNFAFVAVPGEKRMIAGPVMVPDMRIPRFKKDADGKPIAGSEHEVFFSSSTIEAYAKRFFKDGRTANVNEQHTDVMAPAYILESWIVEDPKMDKSVALGFSLPKGTWFATMFVEDETYWEEMVKTGRVKGFSVEGIMSSSETATKTNTHMEKEKFSVTLENGTVIANTDDTDTFEVGQDLWVVLDGNKVAAEDGEYWLPDGEVIVAAGGKVQAIRPAAERPEEPAKLADAAAGATREEFDALKTEMAATLADVSTRVAAIEAQLAEAVTAMAAQTVTIEAQAKTIEKFSAAPAVTSLTVKKVTPAAKPADRSLTLSAFEGVHQYKARA